MHYYSANEFYKKKFGDKVYKIALDAGMTCPNRDGTVGFKGCIFCSENGSGDFCPKNNHDIGYQIDNAISLVKSKIKTDKYIAYFQSFTNTYAPVKYLEKIFTQAINSTKIAAISIATRPDCLGKDVISLLNKLNKIKPVFVELGLQTIHEKTSEYIRRSYPLQAFDNAVINLKAIGVNVIVHAILGLPGENREMMLQTVDYIGKSGADGIKLQLLHVLKGTDLALDYEKGLFDVLTLEEYTDILCDAIEILPPNIVIHRITGDGPKSILIAPLWSGNKKKVLNSINKVFVQRNIIQGSKNGSL